MDRLVYLDNSATVFPKPAEVIDFMCRFYKEKGVNPGRSGYDLCIEAGNMVMETRKLLTAFFGGKDPSRLVFTHNASDSLNIIINGLLKPGDHAISSNLEHNSVIRPLNHLQLQGVKADFLEFDGEGYLDPDDVRRAIRPNTKLVIINHGSNVIGTLQPVAEIGAICREMGVTFAIDTAQTAGVVPIDVQKMNIDVLAFTGHKSLLGPPGMGGIYVGENVNIAITRAGGTGVKSAYPYHLEEYPYRLEVGTGNVIGIAGLNAAQKYIAREGMSNIYRREMELLGLFHAGLAEIDSVKVCGTQKLTERIPVLSINIAGYEPEDVGTLLDVQYNIATRTGLHCAPKVHEQLGTAPKGAVRFSIGPANTREDIIYAIESLKDLASIKQPARKAGQTN